MFSARRRSQLTIGAALLVAVLLLVGCDWPQVGFGPEHTGFNPFETTIGPANVSGLQLRWSATVGNGRPQAPLAIANGTLYLAGDRLYAFDASNGSARWAGPRIGFLGSAPVVDGSVVYVIAHNEGESTLHAFDAASGQARWSKVLGDYGGYSPTVADGVVYVTADRLYAFDAKTGARLWSASGIGHAFSGSPAVAGGVVYAGADKVYAVDAKTGSPLWSAPAGVSIFSTPAVAGGVVYIGNEHLYAFEATTGTQLWRSAGMTGSGSPAVANGVVYVGDEEELLALNATTGAQLWSATPGTNDAAPAVANGVVYTGNTGLQNLHALNAAAGTEVGTARTPVGTSAPVVVNGVLYFSADQLYAYGLPTNAPQLVIAPAFPDAYRFGDPSATARTFTIRNVGTTATSVITARVSGADAAHFRVTADGCGGKTLAAGASCAVVVSLAPTRSGSLTASLAVTAAAGGTVSAVLVGTADPLTIVPSTMEFGIVFAGSTSTRVLTVTNLRDVPVGPIANISATSIFSTSADGCAGKTLLPRSSCTITVKFAPTYSYGYGESLAVAANDVFAGATLSGSGRAQLAFSPASKDFGQVRAGTTVSSTFTITNISPTAAGPIADSVEPIFGQHFDWFRLSSDNCRGKTLAAGAACTVVVTFAPTSTGFANGDLRASGPTAGITTAGLVGWGS